MSKRAKKNIIYALLSLVLSAGLFLLTWLPIFSRESKSLYAILLFVPIMPVFMLLHGVISGLLLDGRARMIYILVSPLGNLAVAVSMIYAVNFGGSMSLLDVLGGFFTYPIFILTSLYLTAGWLGFVAVKIFKKFRVFLIDIYKLQ